jgi:hypothetical protein
MRIQPGRLALLLAPLVLAACSSDQSRAVQLLDSRMQNRLAPQISNNQVAIARTGDGSSVIVKPASSDQDNFILAGMIQGLLDPNLLHVQVSDSAAPPDTADSPRLQNAVRMFHSYSLGNILEPVAAPANAPPGLTLTVAIHCPYNSSAAGWGYGPSQPSCH